MTPENLEEKVLRPLVREAQEASNERILEHYPDKGKKLIYIGLLAFAHMGIGIFFGGVTIHRKIKDWDNDISYASRSIELGDYVMVSDDPSKKGYIEGILRYPSVKESIEENEKDNAKLQEYFFNDPEKINTLNLDKKLKEMLMQFKKRYDKGCFEWVYENEENSLDTLSERIKSYRILIGPDKTIHIVVPLDTNNDNIPDYQVDLLRSIKIPYRRLVSSGTIDVTLYKKWEDPFPRSQTIPHF